MDVLEYPYKVELGFSRNSNFFFSAGQFLHKSIRKFQHYFGLA